MINFRSAGDAVGRLYCKTGSGIIEDISGAVGTEDWSKTRAKVYIAAKIATLEKQLAARSHELAMVYTYAEELIKAAAEKEIGK